MRIQFPAAVVRY